MGQLLIGANNCEGDCMCVAFTIIVGDTHTVAFTTIGSVIIATYVYIAHIHMYI